MQSTIIIPLLAALAIALCNQYPNLRESITIFASLILLGCVIQLYQLHIAGVEIYFSWGELLPNLGIHFSSGSLSILFALVASFLWLITSIYAIGYMRDHKEKNQTRFYVCFAIAISSVMGIAFSDNLLTLFIFYEILTLSTFPLVTHAGTRDAKKGGQTYLAILLGTSIVFFFLAIVITWSIAGTLDFTNGGIFQENTNKNLLGVLLVLFTLGIGKAALMPFHRWLPAAMVAPTPVSALLHAVAVVKAGVFTLIKVCVFIFGTDTLATLPSTQFLLYLACATILISAIIAIRKDNLKARLAYSTISQLGYISVGALLATKSSIIGASMHIATHAFGKITLFFCAGAILITLHKSKISEMNGIGKQMPLTMAAFFIASLSIIGLPPGGGTWSKWFLLLGSLESGQWIIMSTLMLSSLLSIAYLLPISYNAFFKHDTNQGSIVSINGVFVDGISLDKTIIKEAPILCLIAICITSLGCLLLFVFPHALYEIASSVLSSSGGRYER